MNSFNYIKASSILQAIGEVITNPEASFLAGGTNILDLWKYNLAHPQTLVDVNHVEGHHSIEETSDGGVRVGAFVTNADTAYHPLIEARYPLLSKAILAGASAQIRNMATNGGNLLQRTRCYYFYDAHSPCNKREPGTGCSAIGGYNRIMAIMGTSEHCIAVFPSDMCVGLAALDALVNISGPKGNRTLAFADFHRLPGDTPHLDNNLQHGELITSLDLPAKGFEQNYSYLKIRDRNSYAFALVSVATGLQLEGDVITEAHMALGGLAHKPWRVMEAEAFLQNKPATRENFAAAADLVLAGATEYQYNSFKVELAKRAIIRNGMMALNPESQLPGAKASK